jgi:POT family proton-dependent oligopeptide transporter
MPQDLNSCLSAKCQSILGFQVENLTDFFLVFAVMAGGMSLILFCLCPWLNRLIKE